MKPSLLYLLSHFIITLPAVAAGGSGDGTDASSSASHVRVVPQANAASGSKPKFLRGALDAEGTVLGGKLAFVTGLMNCFVANDVPPTGKRDENLGEFLKNSGKRLELMMALKEKGLLPSRKLEGPDHWPLSEEDYWQECRYRLKEGRIAPSPMKTWAAHYKRERRHEYFARENEKAAAKRGNARRLAEKLTQANQQKNLKKKEQEKLPSPASSSNQKPRTIKFL